MSLYSTKQRLIIVGAAGKQGREYYSLIKDKFFVTALVDTNFSRLSELYQGESPQLFPTIGEALEVKRGEIDAAIVCIPHHCHFSVTLPLLQENITVIKDKPLAIKTDEIQRYREFKPKRIYTIVQRQFNEIFQRAKHDLVLLGKIYSFKYEYYMNVPSETDGWRGNFFYSGGGVVIDMGYHIIDIIIMLFGPPRSIGGVLSYCYDYSGSSLLEDSASLVFGYFNNQLSGVIHLNRYYPEKVEKLEILGSNGMLRLTPHSYLITDRQGRTIKEFKSERPLQTADVFNFYLGNTLTDDFSDMHFEHHATVVEIIEQFYHKARQKMR